MAREVLLARYLLAALPAALFVSTSAVVGIEILLYLGFAVSAQLRARLRAIASEPVGIALCVFALMLVAGCFYGIAPLKERLSSLNDWRKLLLFFLAAAVFDDDKSRQFFMRAFVATCLVAAVASYLTWFTPLAIGSYGGGVVVRDYVVQALAFTMATAAVFTLHGGAWRFALAAIFILNVVFVTPARAGYLALLSLALASARNVLVALGLAVACVGLLASSGAVRERVNQALAEYNTSDKLTSVGWRLVMWRNTLSLITVTPKLGVGTGSFEPAYRRLVEAGTGWRSEPTNDPHNQYLKILAENGFAGLTAFLVFIGFAMRGGGRNVLVAWCVAALFASTFSRFTEGRLIFLWLGVMTIPVSVLGRRSGPNEKTASTTLPADPA